MTEKDILERALVLACNEFENAEFCLIESCPLSEEIDTEGEFLCYGGLCASEAFMKYFKEKAKEELEKEIKE